MQYLPPILVALGIICNLFLGFYVFSSNKKAAKDQELQDTKTRLTALETQVKNMPDHEDYGELRVDIAELQGVVNGLAGTLDSINKTVNRIQDYLLNKASQ